MQYQKVATVGIRGNDAANVAALSLFLPAIVCGRYFGARGSHIDVVILRRPRVCPRSSSGARLRASTSIRMSPERRGTRSNGFRGLLGLLARRSTSLRYMSFT
jgi:hypothetical protein